MYYFVNKKKHTIRFAHVLWYFISLYLIALTLTKRFKSANYKSHWNILAFYDQWKIMSDLNMFHGKMSDFVSFPWFQFTLVINLRNFGFDTKRCQILNICHGKMCDFVSLPLFGFTLVKKLRNPDFERNDVRFDYVLSNSVWFGLRFVVWVKFWQ